MERFGTDQHRKHSLFQSARIGLWFSWQELTGRRIVFFINLILITLLIGLAVTLDFMGKARKNSVDNRIDFMGPSLSLVPRGIRSSDLVTAELKGRTFPQNIHDEVRRDFSSLLRGTETRLIVTGPVEQREVPLVGMDFREVHTYPFSKYSLKGDEVLLGNLAARKLNKGTGDEIRVRTATFRIAGIIETTGGIDDVSLFLPLPVLQELTGTAGLINEVRLFPRSASSLEKLRGLLGEWSAEVGVVDSFRGETAEKDIDAALSDYQRVVYTVAFVLIALCILISTYINLDGRKSEISTIYTLGATKGIIFQIISLRTAWIALLGSVAGQFLAFAVTVLKDYQLPVQHIWSWQSFLFIVLGTVGLGLLVTTPFTLYSVYRRNLISHL